MMVLDGYSPSFTVAKEVLQVLRRGISDDFDNIIITELECVMRCRGYSVRCSTYVANERSVTHHESC